MEYGFGLILIITDNSSDSVVHTHMLKQAIVLQCLEYTFVIYSANLSALGYTLHKHMCHVCSVERMTLAP